MLEFRGRPFGLFYLLDALVSQGQGCGSVLAAGRHEYHFLRGLVPTVKAGYNGSGKSPRSSLYNQISFIAKTTLTVLGIKNHKNRVISFGISPISHATQDLYEDFDTLHNGTTKVFKKLFRYRVIARFPLFLVVFRPNLREVSVVTRFSLYKIPL